MKRSSLIAYENLNQLGTPNMFDRRRSIKAFMGLAIAALSVPNAFSQSRKRIAFANISDDIPFGATVLRSLKDAANKHPELELTYMDNRNDAARALENARAVSAARFDLFIEYNIQAGSNLPISRLMQESKIPVLAVQIGVGEAPLFAVDNKAAGLESGRVLAEAARKKWPNETPVVIILGLPEGGPLFAARASGAKESISKVYPGVKFIEYSTHNDAGPTRQLVTDTLTRFPGKKIIFWVHVDAMALSALAAVRNSARGADCLISTTGGDQAAFPEIRQEGSPFLGTYAFFPELWGTDILSIASDMLAGKPVPKLIFPKRQLFLSRDNIATYYPS
jgi:ribose transport system substrate-binding protein